MLINLEKKPEIIAKNVARCREKGITLPTFAQMKNPDLIPQEIKDKLKDVGLWDVNPLNLYRINWHNEPVEKGGQFGGVNFIEIPRKITGTKAHIYALAGKFFPCGVHKVGATYACLAPALVSGNFDAVEQQAVWPSTGNYCRGGAYNSALLGCKSIAILPEDMSQERFNWLKTVAGEQRGKHSVIFNQFAQFENYLWHYEVTGSAILEVIKKLGIKDENVRGYASSTGSGGTLAAGDHLKDVYPNIKIGAGEALQCPTLLRNGFGAHRIEGIGDKHVPWIHNVKNTDMILSIDDQDCMDIYRLFNEPEGKEYLSSIGVDKKDIENLALFGISGIGNMLSAIKMAKYYEMDEDDCVFTILTDSSVMYTSRLKELEEKQGKFSLMEAARVHAAALMHQGIDNALELTYYERLRVHNLKYYTWVEQQGKTYEELNRQWYDRNYWKDIPKMTETIDEMIREFNEMIKG